jgi:hypothetical protein
MQFKTFANRFANPSITWASWSSMGSARRRSCGSKLLRAARKLADRLGEARALGGFVCPPEMLEPSSVI